MHAKTKTPSAVRHAWLEAATNMLRDHFEACDFSIAVNVRVSIGWPKGSRGKAIGQCWFPPASTDDHHELFVSPALKDTTEIAATLAHELAHVAAGIEAKHGRAFRKVALGIGLTGRMTATVAGEKFKRWCAEQLVPTLGEYPSGAIKEQGGKGPQRQKDGTRMLKAQCACCGYTVRLSNKWATVGLPICPEDGEALELAR